VNVPYHIPYSFLRQDIAVTQAIFYGVAGLKSLTNHQLRSYHSHKVWYRGVDEGLIEGYEGIVERLGKLEKEVEERIEEDNMLKSKTT